MEPPPPSSVPAPMEAVTPEEYAAGEIMDTAKLHRIRDAFLRTDRMVDQSASVDDHMSGTTAVVLMLEDDMLHIANVGDSRVIIGQRKGDTLVAFPLSIDQTPYRQDERERCKAAGAVVMSCDQLEGLVPFHENWGVNLGEELDNGGDPPRVWALSLIHI